MIICFDEQVVLLRDSASCVHFVDIEHLNQHRLPTSKLKDVDMILPIMQFAIFFSMVYRIGLGFIPERKYSKL